MDSTHAPKGLGRNMCQEGVRLLGLGAPFGMDSAPNRPGPGQNACDASQSVQGIYYI